MVDDIFNITDTRKKPKGKGGQDIVTGFLVVRGGKLSEAQFEKLYGGVQGEDEPIIFEDADGNVETVSPRKGTDQ